MKFIKPVISVGKISIIRHILSTDHLYRYKKKSQLLLSKKKPKNNLKKSKNRDENKNNLTCKWKKRTQNLNKSMTIKKRHCLIISIKPKKWSGKWIIMNNPAD